MPDNEEPLTSVESADGITVIRGSGNCRGWNGIRYKIIPYDRKNGRAITSP